MNAESEEAAGKACWFVGAAYGGTEDQTQRFIKEGIWETGYKDRYLDLVRSIQPGDRIAIKAAYTRKHDLPFDNRGHTVSVMGRKATGTVTENLGDGQRVKVDWTPLDPVREWYFFTNRQTVWRVVPGDWAADGLIRFTFEGKPQDLERFRNAPYWRERFGDKTAENPRFRWTQFYEEVANKLLDFKEDRTPLVAAINEISEKSEGIKLAQDKFKDGSSGPLTDICPFTAIGLFNRGNTDANRTAIATKLAEFLGVEAEAPDSFEGIPVLTSMNAWFFGYEKDRKPDDIDVLWQAFTAGLEYAEADTVESRSNLIKAFNDAISRRGVGWNLTVGLYWCRHWHFLSLDSKSQRYIKGKLAVSIERRGPKGRINADDYLKLVDGFITRFQEEAYPVHSFPELSISAWLFKERAPQQAAEGEDQEEQEEAFVAEAIGETEDAPIEPYSLEHILSEGSFLARSELEGLLERIRTKKNIILQGPPGTGKTWLAKRLAFALMGQRDDSKVRAVQFHPNLSYEDFVRGWRPTGEGRLTLDDGPFLEMVFFAKDDPYNKYVVVIEEINRGNPAQIFGEMLTLMEADKRTPSEALELCYRREDGERVFIPDNFYVIGTMNIADRSIALVDLALRRRFAFVDLEPRFGGVWQNWVSSNWGIDIAFLKEIEERILALNDEISNDARLGRQFRIGHSYVVPVLGNTIDDPHECFRQVGNTEISPMLIEYWFDDHEKARNASRQLLEGI